MRRIRVRYDSVTISIVWFATQITATQNPLPNAVKRSFVQVAASEDFENNFLGWDKTDNSHAC